MGGPSRSRPEVAVAIDPQIAVNKKTAVKDQLNKKKRGALANRRSGSLTSEPTQRKATLGG